MNAHDLVLLGGGHAHVLAIRDFAMRPIPGVRITLISEQTLTPYSGMLPGYIAGHYGFSETHIDLNQLCQRCGVRWIPARANGLDLAAQRVLLDDSAPVSFDWLSLDTGSRPDTSTVGAAQHAVGVKPVSGFAARWEHLLKQVHHHDGAPLSVGIVGAGAGGVELSLAIAHRLRDVNGLQLHLIFPGDAPLDDYPPRVVAAVESALRQHRVRLHPGFRVDRVHADAVEDNAGRRVDLDHTLWCTAASAPAWPGEAGLTTDARGFVTVDAYLRSVSHPSVFAAGDIAHMPFDPRPKAGVYAVRQAPWLTDNLRRAATGQPLKPIRLQRQFLSLLSLGSKRAVGTRHGLSLEGKTVWWLKDRIDRAFMDRVNRAGGDMPMPAPSAADDTGAMHCAGCASKLGPEVIAGSLATLPLYANPAVQPALAQAEDAARWQPTAGSEAVQSLDGFRAFTRDEYRFGQIAVNHALSDLYAMGATPVSALVWSSLGFSHPRLQARDHQRTLAGVAQALEAQRCVLAGGHSSQGCESHLGLAVTGELDGTNAIAKSGAQPGDWLLLTKALGTGVILAADMRGRAPAQSIEAAFAQMLIANQDASEALSTAHALTDVTGFGLLGHLLEMLDASNMAATLWLDQIPAIPGARELLAEGLRSSLAPSLEHLVARTNGACNKTDSALLIDPQTSGGLLAAVPGDVGNSLLQANPGWTHIGEVTPAADPDIRVNLNSTGSI